MPMLLHYSGIETKGYGCNRVRGQFTLDDAKHRLTPHHGYAVIKRRAAA